MAIDTAYLGKTSADINEQLMTAQQRLAYAQALRSQAMQPIQAPGGQNGRISPLSALAQALNGYGAGQMVNGATHDMAQATAAQAQMQGRVLAGANSEDGPPPAPAPAPAAPTAAPPADGPPPASPSALAGALTGAAPGGAAAPTPAVPAPAADGSADAAAQARALRQRGGTLEALGYSEKAKALYDQAGQIEARLRDRSMPAPTDTEKMLISQGIQRGTPDWNNAMQGAVAKANYIAPVMVAQGNVALSPTTNKPILQNPKMAEGVTADFTNPMAPTASAMPGYAGANAGIVGAAEKAKADQQIRDVTLSTGEIAPVRAGVAADAGTKQAGLGPATYTGGAQPAQDMARWRSAAQAGDSQAKQVVDAYDRAKPQPQGRLGQSQTDKLLTDQGSQLYGQITGENTNNAQHRQILNEMYQLAQTGKFGPGSAGMARVKALASNAGIDLSGAQTDQDVMKKLTSNMVMSQLGQNGTGTDKQTGVLQSMFPNGEITNEAIKKVVPMLVSQIDAREARGKVAGNFLNGGGQMSQLQDHLSKFNAAADPGTISLGHQLAEASKNGTVGQVITKLKQSRPKDWQGVLNRVQQLDQMGAF